WAEAPGRERWPTHVELSREFHEHLRNHAVPLDRRAIAKLAGNSMALDLYATLAYRLPRLEQPVHLRWAQLQSQFGTEIEATRTFAQRLRKVLP
ncbi:replication protein RepA, partial [Acinetobacter baumannii]